MPNITVEVSNETIASLFCSALEGGSNYWIASCELITSDVTPRPGVVWWGSEEVFNGEWQAKIIHYDPDNAENAKTVYITDNRLLSGLQVMARDYPSQFANILKEDYDATDADGFMQCVIFGEVIYG